MKQDFCAEDVQYEIDPDVIASFWTSFNEKRKREGVHIDPLPKNTIECSVVYREIYGGQLLIFATVIARDRSEKVIRREEHRFFVPANQWSKVQSRKLAPSD